MATWGDNHGWDTDTQWSGWQGAKDWQHRQWDQNAEEDWRGNGWQNDKGRWNSGAEDKEGQKVQNMSTFGCGSQKPLPLEKRKDILLGLVEALARPGEQAHILSALAVAAWNAEITMAAFWILSRTGAKTPLRWLKDDDGNFSVPHAVKVLKAACLSHLKTETDIAEVLDFLCDHSWSNCAAITERAKQSGFDPSDVLDLKNLNLAQALAAQQGQSLVQALGGASSSAAQLLTGLGSGTPAGEGGAARFDSRSGARVDKVLKRSDTDEEIERLEKRKKLIALTKELRGEEQSMALQHQAMPSSASGTEGKALPAGLTIAGGTAAAPADKRDTMKAARCCLHQPVASVPPSVVLNHACM